MMKGRFLKQFLGTPTGLNFYGYCTPHLSLPVRYRFSPTVNSCSLFYLLYFPGSKPHLCRPQYSPSSMSSRMCCIFL